MTLKKSMISIAAAGVIAATITGCGSSQNNPFSLKIPIYKYFK